MLASTRTGYSNLFFPDEVQPTMKRIEDILNIGIDIIYAQFKLFKPLMELVVLEFLKAFGDTEDEFLKIFRTTRLYFKKRLVKKIWWSKIR